MAIQLGNGSIDSLKLGSTEIDTAYLGTTEIYSSVVALFDFRATAVDTISTNTFTVYGTINDIVSVDWGDGVIVNYTLTGTGAAFAISDVAKGSGTVRVTSNGTITRYSFGTDTYSTITMRSQVHVTSMLGVCFNLSKLVSFNSSADTSAVTTVQQAWQGCVAMTSFSYMDFINVTSFIQTWWQCTSLTALPELKYNNGLSLNRAFSGSGLTTFSLLGGGSCTDFQNCFQGCSKLVTITSVIDATNGENLIQMFADCTSLECITQLTANGIPYDGTDMFLNTPALVKPNTTEQADLEANGGFYDSGGCP